MEAMSFTSSPLAKLGWIDTDGRKRDVAVENRTKQLAIRFAKFQLDLVDLFILDNDLNKISCSDWSSSPDSI